MKKKFAWDDLAVYIIAFSGVFACQYLKVASSKGHTTMEERIAHILFSGMLAFMFVLQSEGFGSDEVSRAGKKKNLRKRMFEALNHGLGTSGAEALAT